MNAIQTDISTTRRQRQWTLRGAVLLLVLVHFAPALAQIVPFYPPEITFGVLGYTNDIPGCKQELYVPFAFTKLQYHREFLTVGRWTSTLLLYASYERYLDATKARGFHPLSANPVLTTYCFVNDIFTLGLEAYGNISTIPGITREGDVFAIYNRRLKVTPFHILIAHPNLIVQERLTYGMCRNSDETYYYVGDFLTDYDMLRYEVPLILLTPLHIRVLLTGYAYHMQYLDLPARANDRVLDASHPPLREAGGGGALGLKYYNYRWGTPEAALEFEANNDLVYGENDYLKWKVRLAWENQYFLKHFGYNLKYEMTRVESSNPIVEVDDEDGRIQEVWRTEHLFDAILIFNINRNFSIRPEYDMRYQRWRESEARIKHRFWLNLHIIA